MLPKLDLEWELMLAGYLRRVPAPVFRDDPPVRTRIEEQHKSEVADTIDEHETD